MENSKLVQSSYSEQEVTILLQDVQGKVPVLDTKEREKLNQSLLRNASSRVRS